MKCSIVIAESALELVPKAVASHPAAVHDAKRRSVRAEETLLDRSIHHAAMLKLKDGLKRGRPDLVHIALLCLTSSPLYREGKASVYIHTYGGTVLELADGTRPPKNYLRFRSLMERLLVDRPAEGLVRVYNSSLEELVGRLTPDAVVGLSIQGAFVELPELAERLQRFENPVVLVGGFARGHFTPATLRLCGELVRIHSEPLDAHVVASRLAYELERQRAGIK